MTEVTRPLNKLLYFLVLFSGALSVFAFAPFKLYFLAWVTPIGLFYALTKAQSKKQHILLGWFFAMGLFGAGASWPFYSIYYFAHAPLAVALGIAALFSIGVAFLTGGLFGWIVSFYKDTPLLSRLLLFYPAAWVLVEWYRSWFLTGFPWLYLGNTQIDSILSAVAPITGVLGVSLVCLVIAGAILSFLLGNSVHRTVTVNSNEVNNYLVNHQAVTEEKYGSSARIIAALILVLITLASFSLTRVDWTQTTGKPLTVSVLQSNISQHEKLDPANLNKMINIYQDMTHKSRKSDLIVWPETGLFDFFNNHMSSLITPLQKTLKNTDRTIMLGGFYVNEHGGVENSVLALSGDNREIYSKRHLVPFGEAIPFIKYLKFLGDWIPKSNLVAGDNEGTLIVAGQKVQMSICYEDAFGAETIESLPEATLLVNVTHDGWFTGSLEPAQHMQIARMRSLETGRFMVRATTTGPAGIINEKGKLIATAAPYTKAIITNKVQRFTGATPYVRWGNWLIVGLLLSILIVGFFWIKRTPNK
jgi:apolipoprotein N-acyltransferase